MWTIVFSTLLGYGIGMGLVELFDIGRDNDSDDEAVDDPILTDNPNLIELTNIGETVGTDGDDTIVFADETTFEDVETVNAGDGNDTLRLFDETPGAGPSDFGTPFGLDQATVSDDNGDDTMTVAASSSTISGDDGDDGDDSLTVLRAGGSTVLGGAGDDLLVGISISQDAVIMDGGDGKDILDGRLMDNVALIGGEGADLILITGHNQPGAGYVVSSIGQAGDDIIRYDGDANTSDRFDAQTVFGGDGNDRFEVRFNEGGTIEATQDGTTRVEVLTIGDFDPAQDTIVIGPDVLDQDYVIQAAELIERADDGQTDVVMTYESQSDEDRTVIVTVNTIGLELDDFIFVDGTDPANLVAQETAVIA